MKIRREIRRGWQGEEAFWAERVGFYSRIAQRDPMPGKRVWAEAEAARCRANALAARKAVAA